MSRAGAIIAGMLGALSSVVPDAEPSARPRAPRAPWRGPAWKRPRPQRYFGGRSARRLTRRIRLQLGQEP